MQDWHVLATEIDARLEIIDFCLASNTYLEEHPNQSWFVAQIIHMLVQIDPSLRDVDKAMAMIDKLERNGHELDKTWRGMNSCKHKDYTDSPVRLESRRILQRKFISEQDFTDTVSVITQTVSKESKESRLVQSCQQTHSIISYFVLNLQCSSCTVRWYLIKDMYSVHIFISKVWYSSLVHHSNETLPCDICRARKSCLQDYRQGAPGSNKRPIRTFHQGDKGGRTQ